MSGAITLDHLQTLKWRVEAGVAEHGICVELVCMGCGTKGLEILERCFESWPGRTKDDFKANEYPVPDPVWTPAMGYTGWEAAKRAYQKAERTDTMWEGAYGDLRKRLLAHCIATLENKLYVNPSWDGL